MFVQKRAFSYHRFNDPTKRVITDVDEFWDAIEWLSRFPRLAFDTETSGTAYYRNARICGASFAAPIGDGRTQAFYFPVRHQTGEEQLPVGVVMAGVKRLIENPNITKVCWNLKFEMHMLAREGITFIGPRDDGMVKAHLYDENTPLSLKERALADLGDPTPKVQEDLLDHELKLRAKEMAMGITEFKDTFGYAQLPVDLCGTYACHDTDATLRLDDFYNARSVPNYFARVYQTEIDLEEALFEMEENGMPIDVPYLEGLKVRTQQAKDALEPQIFSRLQSTFNIGSDPELRHVLTNRLGLQLWKRTDKGELSVDKEVLEHFADDSPVCSLILDWRQASKINSTYTDSILKRLDANGVLHGDIKQLGTNTGRASSEKPNLQNFAGDSDKRALAFSGKKLEDGGTDPFSVKRAFVNRGPGWHRRYWDYSQIELRVLAFYSRDPTMLDVYLKGQDIHDRTSMEVFGKIEKALRRIAKIIAFGLNYMMSAAGLARQAKLNLKEAEAFMAKFFERYPRIIPFRRELFAYARAHANSIQNIFGRARRIQELSSFDEWRRARAERQMVGSCIQGTAADLMKESIVRVHKWEKRNRAGIKLCSTIHDELSADVPNCFAVEVGRAVRHEMESYEAEFAPIPIVIDDETSFTNWAEKVKTKTLLAA